MSAGVFTQATYESDVAANKYPCRVQPETITAWNANGGVVTAGLPRVRVRGGRREFGVYCRRISGTWTTAPAGYETAGSVVVPVFTKAAYDAISLNASLAYLGGNFVVVGKSPEQVR